MFKNNEKIIDHILIGVLIVFCIVLAVMGFDIESKLDKLQNTAPVSVSQSLTSQTPTETSTQNTIVTGYETTTQIVETSYTTENQTTITEPYTTTLSQSQATIETSAESTVPASQFSHHDEHGTSHNLHDDNCEYYITVSGSKYHIDGCSHLSKSKISITLDDAISKGYEPCSRCIK